MGSQAGGAGQIKAVKSKLKSDPLPVKMVGRLGAALVTGDEDLLRESFHLALDAGVPVGALREVIFTATLFDGYPAALEGFRVLASLIGQPPAPVVDVTYTAESIGRWRERGERLCKIVYGPQYGKLTGHVAEFAPELADAMIVEGYGKVLARPELDPKLRELAVVAMLAVKHRPRQLLSHCLGALRLGATPTQLNDLFDAVEEVAGSEKTHQSRRVLFDALGMFTAADKQ